MMFPGSTVPLGESRRHAAMHMAMDIARINSDDYAASADELIANATKIEAYLKGTDNGNT